MNRILNLAAERLFTRRSLLGGLGAGLLASSLPARGQMGMMDMNTYQPTNTFAHIAYGMMPGGAYWKTSFMFINNGNEPAAVQLLTWGTGGAPMAVHMMGGASGSQQTYNIPVGGSTLVELDQTAAASVMTGWAGLAVTGSVAGQGIFKLHNPPDPDFEATVPLVMRPQPACATAAAMMALPFDNSNGYITSVAFANTAPAARMLDLEFVNTSGAVIFTAHEPMAAHAQMSFATPTQYPAAAGQQGWMRVLTNPSDFTALGFRFNPVGPFTTWMPIVV